MSPERLNVAVFGAGPAGLSSAMEIANAGHNVEVITPETSRLPHSVYTTDRFVSPESVQTFFRPESTRKLPIIRIITSNGTDFKIHLGPNNARYFMVDYPSTLDRVQKELSERRDIHFSPAPMEVLNSVQIEDHKSGVTVLLDGQKNHFDLVVDATGVGGKVDETINPNHEENFLAEYVYGGTFRGNFQDDEIILIFGPAGGTSWANPSIEGNGFVDVVFSAWGPKRNFSEFLREARTRLDQLVGFLSGKPGIEIQSIVPEYVYSGLIRSQPTRVPSTQNVYAVGEAAGMAKPTSGDSIRRAIIAGRLLAESVKKGESPRQFHHRWRKTWKSDNFYLAGALARLSYQKRGKIGGTMDQTGIMLRESNTEDADKFVSQFEEYITDGKLNLGLLARLLSSKMFVLGLTATAIKQLELKFREPVLPKTLPLPEI